MLNFISDLIKLIDPANQGTKVRQHLRRNCIEGDLAMNESTETSQDRTIWADFELKCKHQDINLWKRNLLHFGGISAGGGCEEGFIDTQTVVSNWKVGWVD